MKTKVFSIVLFSIVFFVWTALIFKVVTTDEEPPQISSEPCIDKEKECEGWAATGQCDGIQATDIRNTCRRSCGVCLVGKPRKFLPPKIPPSTSLELARMYRGDVGMQLRTRIHSQGTQLKQLLSTVPGLWQRAPLDAICSRPVNSPASNSVLDKVRHHTPPSPAPRILCMVDTTEAHHTTKVESQARTWAKGCAGWVAMSTVFDPTVPALEVPHEGLQKGENSWQKARSIWAWANKTQADSYDYFLLTDDDTYVHTANLKAYLHTLPGPHVPLYIGRQLRDSRQKIDFNVGGAGTVLSRAALMALASSLDDPSCSPHKEALQDVQTARCLLLHDIRPEDTRDETKAERFHPLSPDSIAAGGEDSTWLANYSLPPFKPGVDGISSQSISFHYLSVENMRGVHAAVTYCKKPVRAGGIG